VVMLERIRTYFYRRRKHSYNEMWEMLYGDGTEGSKGYIRNANFGLEVAGMWKQAYEECRDRYNNTKPE